MLVVKQIFQSCKLISYKLIDGSCQTTHVYKVFQLSSFINPKKNNSSYIKIQLYIYRIGKIFKIQIHFPL